MDGATTVRRFVAAVLLLLAEVAALTPWVEFTSGTIQYLASARVCAALLFGLVAFGFLVGDGIAPSPLPLSPTGRGVAVRGGGFRLIPARLLLHLAIYVGFFFFTLRLSRQQGLTSSSWIDAFIWSAWAVGVGVSCFLVFFSRGLLFSLALQWPGRVFIACGLGLSLALLTPWVWDLWPWASRPAMLLDWLVLSWSHGEAIFGINNEGFPVLGTRKLLITITPQCSELEALIAYWLLWGTVMAARWRVLSLSRSSAVLVIGTVLLYVLVALRLYGLVTLGLAVSAQTCVDLAHSRVGTILLLGAAAALTCVMLRWCRRQKDPAGAYQVSSRRAGDGLVGGKNFANV